MNIVSIPIQNVAVGMEVAVPVATGYVSAVVLEVHGNVLTFPAHDAWGNIETRRHFPAAALVVYR